MSDENSVFVSQDCSDQHAHCQSYICGCECHEWNGVRGGGTRGFTAEAIDRKWAVELYERLGRPTTRPPHEAFLAEATRIFAAARTGPRPGRMTEKLDAEAVDDAIQVEDVERAAADAERAASHGAFMTGLGTASAPRLAEAAKLAENVKR